MFINDPCNKFLEPYFRAATTIMWMRQLIWERTKRCKWKNKNKEGDIPWENVSMYLGIFLKVQSRGSHFLESRYGLKLASYKQHRWSRPSLLLSESLEAKSDFSNYQTLSIYTGKKPKLKYSSFCSSIPSRDCNEVDDACCVTFYWQRIWWQNSNRATQREILDTKLTR